MDFSSFLWGEGLFLKIFHIQVRCVKMILHEFVGLCIGGNAGSGIFQVFCSQTQTAPNSVIYAVHYLEKLIE